MRAHVLDSRKWRIFNDLRHWLDKHLNSHFFCGGAKSHMLGYETDLAYSTKLASVALPAAPRRDCWPSCAARAFQKASLLNWAAAAGLGRPRLSAAGMTCSELIFPQHSPMAVTASQCSKSSFRKRRADESSHLGALLSRDFAPFDGRNSRRELESFSGACTRHYDLGVFLLI
jgi:hypothetical protein